MVMKGHERNITRVLFNRDGDLLFSAASDKTPTVWDTETGTYNGHSGSITDMSVSWNSKRLVTASGDCQVKLWDVQTGEELLTYTHSGPVQVFYAPEDADQESLSTASEVLIEIRPREERPTK
eukprot:evm.model.NODE_11003_length_7677_cov_20.626026.4